MKNVLAIATGICDGLGLGNNARAALITRGLVEITRFGEALGAKRETFMGLAGMGDLMLTCTGDLSRNRRVGLLLAEGKALPDIVRELGHVAEGVPAAREVARRAAELGIDMPITRAVTAVLDGRITPVAAVEQLMAAIRSTNKALAAAGEVLLPPGLVNHHRHGVGEVEAAVARDQRQAQAVTFLDAGQNVRRQAARFGTEDEGVAREKVGAGVTAIGLGRQREQPRIAQRGAAGSPVRMHRDAGHRGVVQPGAAQLRVREVEAERFHQMQAATGIGAQADRVAGVGRDFRGDEDDVEHVVALLGSVGPAPTFRPSRSRSGCALAFGSRSLPQHSCRPVPPAWCH